MFNIHLHHQGIAMSKLHNHLLDFQKTKLHYLYSIEMNLNL